MHWWEVHSSVVWRWRKALGVTCTSNPETHRLLRAAAKDGAKAMQARGLTDEECEERRRQAIPLNLGRFLWHGYHGPLWTKAQLRLLGKEPDEVVARKIGRTVVAVRVMRLRLGIPTVQDRRRKRSTSL
jgi:hypothetical protein